MPTSWDDTHRAYEDGGKHEGTLELITWKSTSDGDELGWGNVYVDEANELKQKFETEFNSSHESIDRTLSARHAAAWTGLRNLAVLTMVVGVGLVAVISAGWEEDSG